MGKFEELRDKVVEVLQEDFSMTDVPDDMMGEVNMLTRGYVENESD